MQSASFIIWTRIAMSISDDDKHYNTDTILLVIYYFVNGMIP